MIWYSSLEMKKEKNKLVPWLMGSKAYSYPLEIQLLSYIHNYWALGRA